MKTDKATNPSMPIDMYGAIGHISNDSDQQFLRQYIEACELMSRCLDQVIYVADYRKQEFAYVSAVPTMLFGLTPRSIINRGFGFLDDYITEEDVVFIRGIMRAWFSFLEGCPRHHLNSYVLSYNLRLKSMAHGELVIANSLIPLQFDRDGHPWLAHGSISMATDRRLHLGRIGLMGLPSYWEYNEQECQFRLVEVPPLSEVSKQVIYLSRLNLPVSEIAKKLGRTESTIKWYRAMLKRQFRVKTFEQVIATASSLKLLWM